MLLTNIFSCLRRTSFQHCRKSPFILKILQCRITHIQNISQCKYSQFYSANSYHYGSSRWTRSVFNKINKNQGLLCRFISTADKQQSFKNKTTVLYISGLTIFMIGMGYAGVPLYRIFCQATGLGGHAVLDEDEVSRVESMKAVKERIITINFNADTESRLQWDFKPQQREIKVAPGETALAFYTARNPTDKPIIGISTYNVLPIDAGKYFNKIQCFCFEEQRLNPHEQVDMPVFFYIDPEFVEDPLLDLTEEIVLSYTFFEAKEGMVLPLPGYQTQ